MKLCIAHISYLNSAPFFAGMDAGRFEMVDLHPRALGQAAEAGEVDAGLMSVADGFRNDDFEPLGDLGIALDGPAHSVLLFSAKPVNELDGATIGITSQTSTSYPLLRLLLDEHHGVRPATFVRREEGPEPTDDGILLIGDAALERAARGGLVPGRVDYGDGVLELPEADPFDEPYRHVLDLAAAWNRWQEQPFVFARWMVHGDVDHADRVMLLRELMEALERNLRHLDEVAERHAGLAGLDRAAAYAYLMGFTYRFGERGERAIRTFRRLLEATRWWEAAPPAVLQGEET